MPSTLKTVCEVKVEVYSIDYNADVADATLLFALILPCKLKAEAKELVMFAYSGFPGWPNEKSWQKGLHAAYQGLLAHSNHTGTVQVRVKVINGGSDD